MGWFEGPLAVFYSLILLEIILITCLAIWQIFFVRKVCQRKSRYGMGCEEEELGRQKSSIAPVVGDGNDGGESVYANVRAMLSVKENNNNN